MNILPCPFCGFDDVEFDEIEVGIIAICCPECSMIGPHQDGIQDANKAVELWNKRRISGPLLDSTKDLLATIELHTDCMTNQIDAEALDKWIIPVQNAITENEPETEA